MVMFVITLFSVYLVFGYQWMGGDPLSEPEVAIGSAKFALTLMLILLSHEMGHYIVARRHGFSLSLPYFIPFPFAFGTLGAVIRLRSPPSSRTALLEMGAAGPIAGFVVSVIAAFIGMPLTENHSRATITIPPNVEGNMPGGVLVGYAQGIDDETHGLFANVEVPEVGLMDSFTWLFWPLEQLGKLMEWVGLVPSIEAGSLPMMILADPPLLKGVGHIVLGEPLSPFATLDPVAFAAWVGCLLTAINMIPIGQLDGGHICNALLPKYSEVIAKAGLTILFIGVIVWPGWMVWGILLLLMGAWRGLPIEDRSPLTARARWVALAAAISMGLSFMAQPIQLQNIPYHEMIWTSAEEK